MSVLTEDDIQFLRALGNELKTQDTGAQRKPVLIQVKEPVKIWGIGTDYADGVAIFIGEVCDATPHSSIDDAKEDLVENYEIDEHDLSEIKTFDDLKEFCDDSGIECFIGGYRDDYRLYQTFLTFSGYEEHMKRNKHNYSHGTHSWMDTHYRNPQMERLIEIIEKFADVNGGDGP